jgi:uncharacterized protein (TIGR02678 family)
VTVLRGAASAVTDALDAAREAERRRAVRALLRSPLLASSSPDFPALRRQGAWVREWFARETGWHVLVDAEHARLRKVPADPSDGTRAATVRGAPLRRRRYVLLCLCLAALERAENQTTLGRLADAVVTAAADPALVDAGVCLALDVREDRSDLAAAVTVLLELGVLRRVAGDENAYVSGAGDALYDVERRVLASLLVTRRGPSLIDATSTAARLAAVTTEPVADTDDARNTALRHALTRRLLDDPVVYYADLSAAELAYLTSQRPALVRRITAATGLEAEIRAEGMAMVDPAGSDALTDVRTPEEGTDGHATLLVAERLAASGPQSVGDLERFVAGLAAEHRTRWRRGAAEPSGVVALTALAVDRLAALRLAALEFGDPVMVVPLPALSRFRLGTLPDLQETLT